MFGFGNSRFKEEARVTVETSIQCGRTMNLFITSGDPELQQIGEKVPSFQTETWVKLLASAQLTHNLLFIQRLGILGVEDFMKTATFSNDYVVSHPLFGLQFSELMIDLVNHASEPKNQRVFIRYGWGRWVINISKRLSRMQCEPPDLNAMLSFDEAKLADKIDYEITKTTISQCDLPYRDCLRPSSLPA